MNTQPRSINKNSHKHVLAFCACGLLSSFFLNGCASTNTPSIIDSGNTIHDPYEGYNRTINSFNMAVDHAVTYPIIRGYRTVTPKPVRNSVSNIMKNLRSPVNLLNQILQGDLSGAGDVLVRATINTSIGIGGIFDVAGYEGISYESEDFGQTLAVWGVGNGPYLVIPFIGGSSVRDYAGFITDSLTDPIHWYTHNTNKEGLYYAKAGIDTLLLKDSVYEANSELERSSFDYYAATRSTYYQYRKAAILDSKRHYNALEEKEEYDALPEIPDFED